jgi:ketosteroid isomerase-like protein
MTPPSQQADVRAIHAVIDREKDAISAGDRDAYLGVLTDDAVVMAPNVPAKSGPELSHWLDDFLLSASVKWRSFTHVETTVVGDLAFHVFTCAWLATPKDGAAKIMHFKGLHVLCRGADGSWRIRREIWNANPETRPPF